MSVETAEIKSTEKQARYKNLNFGLVLKAVGTFIFCAGIWFGLAGELSAHARFAFIVFGLAVASWIFTSVNGTYVALAAAISFSVVGIDQPDSFFEALGDSTVWLLFASFIIAAAVSASGLSNRLTGALVGRAKNVRQLFFLITAALIVSAFVIPATSGRAALMIPVFVALSREIDDARITKALALLFPTIILLSAVASLIGAGAHLITAEILWKMGGEQIGFAEWLMLGLPFAVVSCLVSTVIILYVFLNGEERKRPLNLASARFSPAAKNEPTEKEVKLNEKSNDEIGGQTNEKSDIKSSEPTNSKTDEQASEERNKTSAEKIKHPLSGGEKFVLAVVATLVLLWTTQGVHKIDATLVAIVGALVVTMPKFGIISYKDALKSVNWNLLLFMAATLELGEALIESKAAEWFVQKLFGVLSGGWSNSTFLVFSVVALVSLFSHLLITSRTARASILIPLTVLLAVSLGYNPTTLAFLSTAAAGYCLTLPVSAKPVSMFNQIENVATYEAADLFRLSKYLLPIHFVLLLFFAFLVWPGLGLTILKQDLYAAPPAPVWYENISKNPEKAQPNQETAPQPAATPWAIFGVYNNDENRQRLIKETEKEQKETKTPAQVIPANPAPAETTVPAATPAPQIQPTPITTSTPRPTNQRIERKPPVRRPSPPPARRAPSQNDDDDDDGDDDG